MATAVQAQLQHIPIDKIEVLSNVRHSAQDLDDLVLSIQTFGVIQPLAVRPENGHFVVIAGHRRLAAATLAGLEDVPCLVREDLVDAAFVTAQLIENLQRVDLDPLEEGGGYKRLVDLGLKQKDIASKVGRSEAHVSKRLSLLELPESVAKHVATGALPLSDALELLPIKEPEIVRRVVKEFEASQARGGWFNMRQQIGATRNELERDRKKTAAIAKLKAAGVKVVKFDQNYGEPTGMHRLGSGYGALPIKVADHAKFPCHVAWVDYLGEAHYGCSDVKTHKDATQKSIANAAKALIAGKPITSSGRGAERTKADKEREVRRAQFRKLEPARQTAMKKAFTSKQPREQVLDFTMRQLLEGVIGMETDMYDAQALAAKVVGVKADAGHRGRSWASWIAGGPDRSFKLAYAIALAAGENVMVNLAEPGYHETNVNGRRYIEHLKQHGYVPAPLELEALAVRDGEDLGFDELPPKAKK